MFYSSENIFYRESFVLFFIPWEQTVLRAVTYFLLQMVEYHCKKLIIGRGGDFTLKPLKLEISFRHFPSHFNAFLTCTVTVNEPIQYTIMEMYTSSLYSAYFFIYTLKEVKGLTISMGIQCFSGLKHKPCTHGEVRFESCLCSVVTDSPSGLSYNFGLFTF